MKASKTQKHLKEISYPPEKSFKKIIIILHQQRQMLQFQTSSECPKLTLQTIRNLK